MTPDDSDLHSYSYGLCHAHALAAVGLHGGALLVFTDPDEVIWEHDDGDAVYAVIHVMSVHDTPQGRIARDVHGDVPFAAAQQIVTDRYEIDVLLEEMTHAWELDALIDAEGDGSRPLCALDPADITTAAKLSTVKDIPQMKLVSTNSNTRISYTYRDGDNFAVAQDVIMPGRMAEGDLARIQARLETLGNTLSNGDLGYFVPGQVGLPDLQTAGAEGLAQPFHMIDEIAITDTPADPGAPAYVFFLAQLEAVTWDHAHTPPFHVEMVGRQAALQHDESEPEADTFEM